LLAGWEVHRGAIDKLLQGMEKLDRLNLAVDELLQGMEELDQLDLAVDVEGVAAGTGEHQEMEGLELVQWWRTDVLRQSSSRCCLNPRRRGLWLLSSHWLPNRPFELPLDCARPSLIELPPNCSRSASPAPTRRFARVSPPGHRLTPPRRLSPCWARLPP
jgi:hypothetical protein